MPPVAPADPCQRWRLTFARTPVAPDQVGKAALDAWQDALAASGLPLAGLEAVTGRRARIAFAAPLPAAAAGEAELADVWLLERRPVWAVREALEGRLPGAHRWIDAEDVWLGAPALAGRVAAADWRVAVAADRDDVDRLREAARTVTAARSLPRVRVKGSTAKPYDLRPLVASIAIEPADPGVASEVPLTIRIRTRFHPELGPGRPDEVVAALVDAAGIELGVVAMTRERLVLSDEPPAPRRR